MECGWSGGVVVDFGVGVVSGDDDVLKEMVMRSGKSSWRVARGPCHGWLAGVLERILMLE